MISYFVRLPRPKSTATHGKTDDTGRSGLSRILVRLRLPLVRNRSKVEYGTTMLWPRVL